MNFSQLIEYNLRNIFLEKSCTKCGGKTSPKTFFKKSKLSISPHKTVWRLAQFVFIVCPIQGLP